MRRIIVLLIAFIVVVSCQKGSLSKGLYFADTEDGMIYVELLSANKCLMFFQGEEQYDGTYHISNGKINLMGYAKKSTGRQSVSWWFGGALGTGKINSNSFYIQGQRMSTYEHGYCKYFTFYKH